MPFSPSGVFTLLQGFGTGTAPDNMFPPQVGATLDDIAAALSSGGSNNPYLFKANNLSDLANTSTARTNLGVAIGVNVQAFDAQLNSNVPIHLLPAGAYTTIATDAEKGLLAGGSTATITIEAEVNVNYPVGTCISFLNFNGGNLTIACADTVYLMGRGSIVTGSRTLSYSGMATAIKITSVATGGASQWSITGSGLT